MARATEFSGDQTVRPNRRDLLVMTVASAVPGASGFARRRTLQPSGDKTGRVDTARLQAAAAAGGVWALQRGAWSLSRQVTWSHHDSGFVCLDGVAVITMLTGAGQFDQATYANAFGTNQCGFYCLGFDRPVIEGVSVMLEANPGFRTATAIAVRNSLNPTLKRVEISGFNYTHGGAILLDTVTGGKVHDIYGHDCVATAYLADTQVTLIVVDGNRVGAVGSRHIDFDNIRGENIRIAPGLIGTGAAQFQVNQSDVLTLAGTGYAGHTVRRLAAVNVGEPIDCWTDGNTFSDIVIRKPLVRGISFKWGARNNTVRKATIDQTTLAAVGIFSFAHNPSITDRTGDGNVIADVTVTNAGALWATEIFGNSAEPAFYVHGSNGAKDNFDPGHTRFINCVASGSAAAFTYVFGCQGGGPGNLFEGDGAGYATAFAIDTGTHLATWKQRGAVQANVAVRKARAGT